MSGDCSSRPATAMSWLSTISAACRPGCRIPSAGWPAAVPSPHVGCSPIRTKFCLRPPDRSFSTGSRISSPSPDLADRAILLMLAPIAERQRRPENALWREFELARPHILGALLDVAAHGLRMLPRVRLKRLPRMADFALWATACESAFSPAGTLEAAYSNNRRDAIENLVDADSVAALVREIMADKAQWRGSASDLLQIGANRSGWP